MDKNVIVVGEPVLENEWPEIERMAEEIESCGLEILKLLNYKDGPIKFIVTIANGEPIQSVRMKLEERRWHLGAPYYIKGSVAGFKISKERNPKDVSGWAD